MFTSDNGPWFGGEGDSCVTRFNCDLNGSKMFVMEGGIKVPMILRWPGVVRPGSSDSTMVHMTDWLPTLCGWAGYHGPWEQPLDGVDIGETLRTGRLAGAHTDTRFWQWNRYTPVMRCNAAMREGDWKLVYPAIEDEMVIAEEPDRFDDRLYTAHPEELTSIVTRPTLISQQARSARYEEDKVVPLLFNLATDPGELHDLAVEQPARVSRMKHALEAWFADVDGDRILAQRETLR